jgi:hypothetical protein|tara:strand:- start:247 stop:732 length:486 start_codon:yes stop_codon:yes gene_type:complete
MQDQHTDAGCPCVLSILSFTINDREILPDHSLRPIVYDAFEVAAIEYFEGHAYQIGNEHRGKTLALVLAPSQKVENSWTLYLEDTETGPFRPQLYWKRDENNDQGPAHAAISECVGEALSEAEVDDYFDPHTLKIIVRADISSISSHQKMQLAQTRAKLLG